MLIIVGIRRLGVNRFFIIPQHSMHSPSRISIRTVSQLLSHSSVIVTERHYIDLIDENYYNAVRGRSTAPKITHKINPQNEPIGEVLSDLKELVVKWWKRFYISFAYLIYKV